jgi:hypothetical protein
MSLSWSEHLCQDVVGGGASSKPPEVEDPDAAGEAAMAMVVERRREEEIARKKKAESSGDSPSWLRWWKALEYSETEWLPRTAFPRLNIKGPTTGRSEINGQISSGRQSTAEKTE